MGFRNTSTDSAMFDDRVQGRFSQKEPSLPLFVFKKIFSKYFFSPEQSKFKISSRIPVAVDNFVKKQGFLASGKKYFNKTADFQGFFVQVFKERDVDNSVEIEKNHIYSIDSHVIPCYPIRDTR